MSSALLCSCYGVLLVVRALKTNLSGVCQCKTHWHNARVLSGVTRALLCSCYSVLSIVARAYRASVSDVCLCKTVLWIHIIWCNTSVFSLKRESLIIDIWTFRFVLSLQNRHLRLFSSSHWSPMAFTESDAWLILLHRTSWFSTPALHLLQLHNHITKRAHKTAIQHCIVQKKKSNSIERLLGWNAAWAS